MSNILKRLLSTVLMAAMLISMLCVTAFAAAPSYAHLEAGQATYTDLAVGSEVRIPVSLVGMDSRDYLSGFYCHLDNTQYLTIKSVEFTAETKPWSGGYNSDTQDVNKVQLSAADKPSTAKNDNGLLFTIVYTVAKEIPAGTQVNPSITGVMLNKTSKIFLNSAAGERPTEAEKAASIVYPESGSINVPTPASFTVNVGANKSEAYMDDQVTVTVTANGGTFTGAYYTLTYETDKFALISSPLDAVALTSGNGFRHTFIGYNSPNGTTIGTYTFKALAQDAETTGSFTLGEATVESNDSSLSGNETPATVGSPAPVTIKLIPGTIPDPNNPGQVIDNPKGLHVSAANVEKEYDGNAYGVTAIADKDGATIRYQDAEGNYTLTESPKYSAVGDYTVNFKASLKGYEDAYGSATVTIKAPVYQTESTEYVSGYSLVLVYTNRSGLAFTYDGRTMYDVSAAGYSLEGEGYTNVYGIVVLGNADMTKLAYSTGTAAKIGYSTDINASGKTDLKDVVNTVAVYNADSAYMKDAQMMLVLRADVDHSKTVDNADTTLVLNATPRS